MYRLKIFSANWLLKEKGGGGHKGLVPRLQLCHYASEKLNLEVISRGTFEWLCRFSEGPKCLTFLKLVLESKNWTKKSSYH